MPQAKTYSILVDGQYFDFQIHENLTEPCPQCGIPACGKEEILWYEKDGQRFALIYDGNTFDEMLGRYFSKNKTELSELPHFLQQWYTCEGWVDNSDYNGFQLDITDFQRAIALVDAIYHPPKLAGEVSRYVAAMQTIAARAKAHQSPLKIVVG